jgi:hypothetical protein
MRPSLLSLQDPFASNRRKMVFLVFVLICLSPVLVTGQTTITGKITDAQTLEPLAFANVVFKGAPYGAVTEFDGSYMLSGKTKSDTIIVVLIGYESKRVGIIQDASQVIDVHLHPSSFTLEEITVTPGENPAHILLRKVWKNNAFNTIEKLSAYHYENYSRSTVFLRKFSYEPDEERLIKPFSKNLMNLQ